MSQPEKVSFCLYPDFCRNRLDSPSSTSTLIFKLQNYFEVLDRAVQRDKFFLVLFHPKNVKNGNGRGLN